jgi:hypothetical protein
VPCITIHGENKVLCGSVACFEADVEQLPMTNPWTLTWQRASGDTTKEIDTRAEKYKDSNHRQLVVQGVSKADEGVYQAVLSRRNLKVVSNAIVLFATGGNLIFIMLHLHIHSRI